MRADMDVDVKDAAIIACAQKIEHYEICGYGTARAYAMELGLKEAESLLRQTLDEEYFADNLLTRLAYSGINEDAETTDETKAGGAAAKSNNAPKKAAAKKKVEPKKAATPNINKAAAKAENGKAASKKVAAKTSAPKKASGKK
jgi:hypothetical protein